MSNVNAGLVLVTEFCAADDSTFSTYIDYIDRDEATRKEHIKEFTIEALLEDGERAGYLDYMDDPEKLGGLFTKDKDSLSADEKAALKDEFKTAQENGSLMWQSVISFDNKWLSDMGVYDKETGVLNEQLIKTMVRASVGEMLEKENLSNATWSASMHFNTDNIHIHVATCEVFPMREKKSYKQYERIKDENGKWKYKTIRNDKTGRLEKVPLLDGNGNIIEKEEYVGRFKQSSLKAAKSKAVSVLADNKELNAEITKLMREHIIRSMKENSLYNDISFRRGFLELYRNMPKGVNRNMWKYGTNVIKPLREQIDALSKEYIEKYHKDDFEKLQEKLELQERRYIEAYGGSSKQMENKIDDLYKRLGNSILSQIREFDKALDNQDIDLEPEVENGSIIIREPQIDLEPDGQIEDDSIDEVLIEEVSESDEDENSPAGERAAAALNVLGDAKEAHKIEIDMIFDDNRPFFRKEWSNDFKNAKKLIYVNKDYQKGVNLLYKEAEKGNVLAFYELGEMLRKGTGTQIDIDKANEYYQVALEGFEELLQKAASIKDEAYYSYRIGKMYNYGLGATQDFNVAFGCFEDAALKGNKYAAYSLGNLYYQGKGTDQDFKEAFRCYEESENAYGFYKIAEMLSKGAGVSKDDESANSYYAKALNSFLQMAADSEAVDDNLKYKIGQMYMKGLGTDVDIKEAEKWLSDAAKDGNAYAQYALSKIYLSADPPDQDKIKEAIRLLHQSADIGNNSTSMYALGKIYLNENYGYIDVDKAIEYFEKASESNSTASFMLGKIYYDGEYKERDVEKAIKHFTAAAKDNNEYAQYRLGNIYLQDKNDEFAAVMWYEKAAKAGNAFAKYKLGCIFVDPDKKNFDIEKGIKYLKECADVDNNEFAQVKLGFLYLKGDVPGKDRETARKYFEKAAENGSKVASEVLNNFDNIYTSKSGRVLIRDIKEMNRYLSKSKRDLQMAMRYLRMTLRDEMIKWKNLQEYEELQRSISSDRDTEL